MFQSLDLFRLSSAMASHAGARTAMIARNIANSDTPGFRAQKLGAFHEHFRPVRHTAVQITRAGHLGAANQASQLARSEPQLLGMSPNGNSVSIEEQMIYAAEAQREHSEALAIYRHSLTVLRTAIS
ncbi:MAG: FlgB family protein [Rhodobacteraceae bacterium]|nr:FlgB family protein [Paracoccaceae bacterium]